MATTEPLRSGVIYLKQQFVLGNKTQTGPLRSLIANQPERRIRARDYLGSHTFSA